VDLVEVDHVGLQATQTVIARGLEVFWLQVRRTIADPIHVAGRAGDLGGDHQLLAQTGPRRQPIADKGLRLAKALAGGRNRIHLGGIQEVDATLDCTVHDEMRGGFVHLLAKGHGAQADGCDAQIASAK